MEFKRSVVGAVLIGAAAFSGSAFAGVTGNVGAVSQYMFRGISQGTGAAIQGGLDYAHDSGFYVGTWASNIDWGTGGAEIDGYGGFTKAFGAFTLDVGATYYYYPEEDEDVLHALGAPSANTIEAYVGGTIGPVTLKYFYTPKYFGAEDAGGDDVDGSYFLASAGFPLSDSLKLTASLGYTLLGEEILADGSDTTDDYIDYSVGLAKAIDDSLTATFSVLGTDLKDDDPKVVIGLKKTFAL